ncbi:MAG: hypothetical protein M1830_001619 [Pleopsidium flavum]|nr:MAG: hypothetical protein M1830_001619 [Pleopsidium flavum]
MTVQTMTSAQAMSVRKHYTFLRYDVNLAGRDEEPIPLKGRSLEEAAASIPQATYDLAPTSVRDANGNLIPVPENASIVYSAVTGAAFLLDHLPAQWTTHCITHGAGQAKYYVDHDGTTHCRLTWGFMTLPFELREQVYHHLLVRGKVFPYAKPNGDARYEDWEKYEKPELGILQVSQLVRAEAEEVYYRMNQFVVPRGDPWRTMTFFSHSGATLIRSISIAISHQDLDGHDLRSTRAILLADVDQYFSDGNREHKEAEIHAGLLERLYQEIWFSKGRSVGELSGLVDLTVDVSDANCPHGCCRLAVHAALYLEPKLNVQKWYRRITVFGAKDRAEKRKILAAANGGEEALWRMELELEREIWVEEEEQVYAATGFW